MLNNLLTAFCNFCRQENCYRCLHVYLPVPDCCATGRERSPEWGWRDDKVQPLKYRHLDIQTRSHKGCCYRYSTVVLGWTIDSFWDQGWNIFFLNCLLSFSATWWECSTGRSACWNTASNQCMCLMASPHSSNQQRFVWALISTGVTLSVSQNGLDWYLLLWNIAFVYM